MKTVAILLSVAFQVASSVALAQGGSDPPTTRPLARPAPAGGNWIVSETTSPVDYKPIITASTYTRGGSNGSAMQLSIQCRGSGTELLVSGPAVSRSSAEYAISYRINAGQPVQLAAGSPSSRTGAAFTGDVVRLLQSLPEDGELVVLLSTRTGATQEGYFLLGGLKMVREKLAIPCKWPNAVAMPRN